MYVQIGYVMYAQDVLMDRDPFVYFLSVQPQDTVPVLVGPKSYALYVGDKVNVSIVALSSFRSCPSLSDSHQAVYHILEGGGYMPGATSSPEWRPTVVCFLRVREGGPCEGKSPY